MVESLDCATRLGLYYGSGRGLVHSRGCNLGLARTLFVPGDTYERMGAHGTAPELLSDGTPVLVVAFLCAESRQLWSGRAVCLHNWHPHEYFGCSADVRTRGFLSGLLGDNCGLGSV